MILEEGIIIINIIIFVLQQLLVSACQVIIYVGRFYLFFTERLINIEALQCDRESSQILTLLRSIGLVTSFSNPEPTVLALITALAFSHMHLIFSSQAFHRFMAASHFSLRCPKLINHLILKITTLKLSLTFITPNSNNTNTRLQIKNFFLNKHTRNHQSYIPC